LHAIERESESVALQLMVVEPIGKIDPDGGAHVCVIGAAPPETLGAVYVTGTGLPSADVAATLLGQLIVGAAGRLTLTAKVQEADRFRASVALQLTVVAPTEKSDPEGGVHDWLIGGIPFNTFGAVYVTATAPPSEDVADTFDEQASVGVDGVGVTGGAGASFTSTSFRASAVRPSASLSSTLASYRPDRPYVCIRMPVDDWPVAPSPNAKMNRSGAIGCPCITIALTAASSPAVGWSGPTSNETDRGSSVGVGITGGVGVFCGVLVGAGVGAVGESYAQLASSSAARRRRTRRIRQSLHPSVKERAGGTEADWQVRRGASASPTRASLSEARRGSGGAVWGVVSPPLACRCVVRLGGLSRKN
jgi:hypothetical protein